jgi:hypothetical protein
MGGAGFPREMRPRCRDADKPLDVRRPSKCLQGTSPRIECEWFERIYSRPWAHTLWKIARWMLALNPTGIEHLGILRDWVERETILIYLARLTIGTRAMLGCGMRNSIQFHTVTFL